MRLRRRHPDEPLVCREVRKVVQSFLDGELSAEHAHLVAAHIAVCEVCGLDARTLDQVRRAVAGLDRGVDPDALARLERFADRVPELS